MKKIIAIVLTCLLLVATCLTCVSCNRKKYISFGSYPQSRVTDATLTSTLSEKAGALPTAENSHAWTSYGYPIGESSAIDYMWYIDLEEGGEKYRGVYFVYYRPYRLDSDTRVEQGLNLNNSYQDENGYLAENVYWFKYEPIKWRILEEANGEALIHSDMILDSMAYSYAPVGWPEREEVFDHNGGRGYANNYALSDIRKWLNATFYDTAFSDAEKQQIVLSTVENGEKSTNPNRDPAEWNEGANPNACEDTKDYVFLLSAQEVTNKDYGFSKDPEASGSGNARRKDSTDYTLAQGIYTDDLGAEGHGAWWLRSADFLNNHCARYVKGHGYAEGREVVDSTVCGVVPAIRIKKN